MAAILPFIGIEPIARSAYLILPFGGVALMTILLLLYDKVHRYNAAPWLGNGLQGVVLVGLYVWLRPSPAGTGTEFSEHRHHAQGGRPGRWIPRRISRLR